MPKDREENEIPEEELDVIVEGEETEEPQPEEPEEAPKEEKKASKKAKIVDEDESEDEDDEPEEDAEEIRARRRAEKLERKERREKAIERDKVEMNYLRQRNEALERRMMAQEMRANRQDHYTVEQQIAEAENDARTAEAVMARAIAEANGDDAARALRIRDEAMEKIRQLSTVREEIKQQEKTVKQPQKTSDPVITRNANEWISKNVWYNPNGKDSDSRIVLTIDQGLVDEGYDPRSEEYWKELDRRVRRYLPHRVESDSAEYDDYDEPTLRSSRNSSRTAKNNQKANDGHTDADERPSAPKKGPPIGSNREHAPSTTRREVYITKERKDALIQAGVWDDPVLRKRYINQYQKWDKENATR